MLKRNAAILSDDTILGNCSLFVCRNCRTKYGWEHQVWCELYSLIQPTCKECRYYRQRDGACMHPRKRSGKERVNFEETQGAF